MHELNAKSLEMIKKELAAQCSSLQASCESCQQEVSEETLEKLVSQFTAMRGACEILEINSVARLSNEVVEFLQNSELEAVKDSDFCGDLSPIIKTIEGYLGFTYNRGYDQPLLLLPEINSVRKAAGKPLLSEADFLDEYLPSNNIIDYVNEKSSDIRLIIRRARHLYQQGLIHAIRGTGQSGAFRIMSHAVRRMHESVGDEAEKRYWLLVFQVVDSFAKRVLVADKAKLRSLMSVEGQLRQLVKGSTQLEQCYPAQLQRTMMAYLLLANVNTDPVMRLFEQLGVNPQVGFDDQQLKSDRALLGSDGEESFSDTMSLLRDKIDQIAALIQAYEEQELPSARDQFMTATLSIADICGLSGLAKGATLFSDYAQQLQDRQDQTIDSNLIHAIIDSVLYLECLLLEMKGQPPSAKQLSEINSRSTQEIIETNIARHAKVHVLDEAKAKLRDVMSRLTDMQEGVAGFALNDDFHEVFDTVSGATQILELEKASKVARQCSQYARSGKLLIDIKDPSVMAAFADVLVSLEYFLDNCRWDPEFDDAVLDIALECLEQLKK